MSKAQKVDALVARRDRATAEEADAQGALAGFHPAVQSWFTSTFSAPTPAQAQAWPRIRRGESTLVFAPTGSGKTLSAFLGCIDKLVVDDERAAAAGADVVAKCRVVYVSPLKALASDIERNLQAPLVGIDRCAHLEGRRLRLPTVSVRTGDTPQRERARFARHPTDILITTPESLFLLLTSKAREALKDVETVIVDEIHALVPSKRGAHLALSLARLEALTQKKLQRIGLSATARPLDEVARYLGGYVDGDRAGAAARAEGGGLVPAAVGVVDARGDKQLQLTVEHTLIDAADAADRGGDVGGSVLGAGAAPLAGTTWKTIPPQLVQLAKQHRTTLVFVNSRRLAERLSGAVNDAASAEAGAEVEIAAAHHGSLARAQRVLIEERLKRGLLQVLVCTSSLELGIDVGSVDVVVQIEAPPSVAAGLQRVGRSGHTVGAVSRGVVFPRYASDLLACAATTAAMHEGAVEATRIPKNPLDVLIQHLVAMVALEPWHRDALYAVVRRAAPFADLPRALFDGCLDLLSGKTAVDLGIEDVDAVKARVVYDRDSGVVRGTAAAHRVVVQNAGTIPDRGLYGVFLAGGDDADSAQKRPQKRVGELDEEMVFETKRGELFRLGASTWRVEEITHDKVLVSPAPGEPGKLPFWRGEQPLRPKELGERIGGLTRRLLELPRPAAHAALVADCGLKDAAADKLIDLLHEQRQKGGGVVPDDRVVVVERSRDELGDWRLCLLSPLGGQVLQPLALAMVERAQRSGVDLEMSSSNDGIVLRVGDAFGADAPDIAAFVPDTDDVEALVVSGLAGSALFAARFREAAGRALMLPRRRPGQRAPLWKQRQRAQDLLAAVARVGDFPIVLETVREIVRDVFDLPALTALLDDLRRGRRRLVTVDVDAPSPFAAALLSGFLRGAIYDGDVPLAERRAQALAVDHDQLKLLLGDAELRELLDDEVIAAVEALLQQTDAQTRVKNADQLHDLLLRLGHLSLDEVKARVKDGVDGVALVDELVGDRRAFWARVGGAAVVLGVEDAGRYRDAVGVSPPPGVPDAFLTSTKEALTALVRRFVKSHALVTVDDVAARFGVSADVAGAALAGLVRGGVLVDGSFRPFSSGGGATDYADPEVLRTLRRRTLARLRREVEPVDVDAFVRARLRWHGLARPRRGHDGLLDVVAALQGTPLLWSTVERDVLPARVADYRPEMLDALAAAGEVVWVGAGAVGDKDGRVLLFLADDLPRLWSPPSLPATPLPALSQRVLEVLRERGASFYADLAAALSTPSSSSTSTPTSSGSAPPSFAQWQAQKQQQPGGVDDALWSLAFAGRVSNDTFRPLRVRLKGNAARGRRRERAPLFRSRREAPPGVEGRWSLVPDDTATRTARAAAVAQQLARRDGVVARGALDDFDDVTAVYAALKAAEEGGRLRRGYFVAGLGGMQFADPAAVDELRRARVIDDDAGVCVVAASDPANPFGTVLPWPKDSGCSRAAGAWVVIVDGHLAAWIAKSGQRVVSFLADDEPLRARMGQGVARALADRARAGRGVLVADLDGADDVDGHPLTPFLRAAGFHKSAGGLLWPRHDRRAPNVSPSTENAEADADDEEFADVDAHSGG